MIGSRVGSRLLAPAAALVMVLAGCTVHRATVELDMRVEGGQRSGPCRNLEVGDRASVRILYPGSPTLVALETALSMDLTRPGGVSEDVSEADHFTVEEPGRHVVVGELRVNEYELDTALPGFPLYTRGRILTGRCTFDVLDPAVTTTAVDTGVRYDVESVVIASTTGGVGNTAQAVWVIDWPCSDARCDGRILDGGPRGGFAVDIRFEEATESWRYETTVQRKSGGCSHSDVSGVIEGTEWDEAGPTRFTYTVEDILRCPWGDATVIWEGAGTRAP